MIIIDKHSFAQAMIIPWIIMFAMLSFYHVIVIVLWKI